MDTSHENRERLAQAQLPRVVIVGGGFGGLYAARGLARGPVTVTIVDKHNYHLFRPMLYQVATGLLWEARSVEPAIRQAIFLRGSRALPC